MKDNINYATDQLKVPPDYGTATCLSCGGLLNRLWICAVCNCQFDGEAAVFFSELRGPIGHVDVTIRR